MSNQDYLNEICGGNQSSDEHQTLHLIEGTFETLGAIYLFIWIVKRLIKYPRAGFIAIAFGALAVWSALVINHGDWYFYPLAVIALAAMGRVIR
ncbi:MAG: hypothetical protein ACLP8X_00975 [Streptosporangiaceae bacterium]